MIKRNTVLILGAGASIPYGYPSGRELKNKISKSLDDSSWMEVFNRRGVSRLVGQFKDQITYSGRTSVDAFLEYRKEFLEIGKMAIALALIPFEDEKRLFDHNRTVRNWYEYLFNKMSEGVAFSELPSNCISIITFNYDRSLEQYLFTSIGNSYGESPEHCKSVMKQFPIIHLHGSLGYLPWQTTGWAYEYNDQLERERIYAAADQIKIVSEIRDDPEFGRAHELLAEADVVYMLGFGYNPVNIQRLSIDRCKNNILGSSFGLGGAEIKDIETQWKKLTLTSPNHDVLDFFKNCGTLQ